jgi:tRNA-dihydrouridine synthase B
VRIGSFTLANPLAVAPMAGVTDRPFRQLCKRLGAAYAVSEMVAANPRLRDTDKSRRRTDHEGEVAPIAVQIAGADPAMMADAARYNVDRGAQIIDINMGCPAKKVCNVAAGSALLADPPRVAAILEAVVAATGVPVTLKIRTGPAPHAKNAVHIAKIAEASGVAALTVHGRTRACMFVGPVDHATIADVKRAVSIPVIANGDIDTPERARDVLAMTGADAVMIGRAAQGRPWIFAEIAHFLATGEHLPPMTVPALRALIALHLADHYAFYGEDAGVRIARKHLGWYLKDLAGKRAAFTEINAATTVVGQTAAVDRLFDALAAKGDRLEAGAGTVPPLARRGGGLEAEQQAGRQAAAPWAGEALAA